MTRAQCIKIINEPRSKGVIGKLAKKYGVSKALIQHIRHRCKEMLRGQI